MKLSELAEKVAKEKQDFVKKFPSAKQANNFAWAIARHFDVGIENSGISTWKRGQSISHCEMDNEVFSYLYETGWGKGGTVYISFKENSGGKSLQETREEMKLQEAKNKLLPKKYFDLIDAEGAVHEKSAKDIKVIAKLFNPTGGGTWYIYDYDREEPDRLWCFANLGDVTCAECGTVWLPELAEFKGMFGLGIERDKFFEPGEMTLQEVMDKVYSGVHV